MLENALQITSKQFVLIILFVQNQEKMLRFSNKDME
jgi:hypothetical protein